MVIQSTVTPVLLDVRALRTEFRTEHATVTAVNDVSFTVAEGERIAVVGESGSGKSAMAMSLLQLLAHPGRVAGGDVLLDGRAMTQMSERDLTEIRGREIGTVFQDPMSSLDPVMRISKQMIAPIMRSLGLSRAAARQEAIMWLDKVGIPDAAGRIDSYPFEMSGGMRQRVMIAMALSCKPRLIIADEPTTALDVTIQAQIVALLTELTAETGTAMLFITHDLGLVASFAHKVAVMYAGRIVELGDVGQIFAAPKHPYTQSLLAMIPSVDTPRGARLAQIPGTPPDMRDPPKGCAFADRCAGATETCRVTLPPLATRGEGHMAACWLQDGVQQDAVGAGAPLATRLLNTPPDRKQVVVELNKLHKHFISSSAFSFRKQTALRAVNGVSLRVLEGDTLGIVGESGCGKSTVARLLLGLDAPTHGEIFIDGLAQMVFQDPNASFNPRMRIRDIVLEPLMVKNWQSQSDRLARADTLMDQVGLERDFLDRFPHQLSGGQRQRVAIARALALNPSVVVADEPTSALDVSVRAQIINLLSDLKDELGVSFVFISHDLLTVRFIADQIAVMYLGEVVEYGPSEEVFDAPAHPYTRALVQAVPIADPELEAKRERVPLQGELPSPLDLPTGCAFASRCLLADDRCRREKPVLIEHKKTRQAACHYAN